MSNGIPGPREESSPAGKKPIDRDIAVIPEKKKLVTSADDMEGWYKNPDGSLTEFGKNTIEPYIETSKAMSEGMTEPLGHGQEVIAKAIDGETNPDVKTAGIASEASEDSEVSEAIAENLESNPESIAQTAETVATPKATDSKEEVEAKTKYKESTKGILGAYLNGEIDKGTAAYFLLDSLSTLARNTGKDITNIAAAFSGGTIDTSDREESLWSQKQRGMIENEISSDIENMTNTPAYRAMQHDLNSLTTEDQQIFKNNIENYIANAGKDLTVEGLRKQIELMGLNVDAAKWAQLLHEPILQMINSGKTSQQIAGYLLGGAIQAAPTITSTVGGFLK